MAKEKKGNEKKPPKISLKEKVKEREKDENIQLRMMTRNPLLNRSKKKEE